MKQDPKQPNISIIAAITNKNRSIGKNNKLLIWISDDLKRFKNLTLGHPIVMGRKTYESIGRVLPGRKNLIVTKNHEFKVPEAVICSSLDEAIEKAWAEELQSSNQNKEIFLIGGGEIYKQGLSHTNKLYLTLVESDAEGDVFFPDYSDFKKVLRREDRVDEKTSLRYSWVDLVR